MKQLLLYPTLLFALCSMGLTTQAQDPEKAELSKEKMDKIKAQKSAYITTKLKLSAEQAQQFWPIYNAYDAEKDALRMSTREMNQSARNKDAEMTESQAADLLTRNLENKQKELDLERLYTEKFKKNIGAVKTMELHRAERDFHREVLRRLKERMGDDKEDGTRNKR